MEDFKNCTAVVTGAASGVGRAICLALAERGVNLVMADIEADALQRAAAEVSATGARLLSQVIDVSKAADVDALGTATLEAFGAPHLVFNNAGVSAGGLVWENSAADWQWVLGINLMGVIHGLRVFTPMMLDEARRNACYQGHIVNTASLAGLICAPNMGAYNVSKHAVVALSETLYQDLKLVTDQISASVICPSFVRTAIADSKRNRPSGLANIERPTRSQRLNQAMASKAVSTSEISAHDVAMAAIDAVKRRRFYVPVLSPSKASESLASLRTRLDDLADMRNPSDPFALRPETGDELRRSLGVAERGHHPQSGIRQNEG